MDLPSATIPDISSLCRRIRSTTWEYGELDVSVQFLFPSSKASGFGGNVPLVVMCTLQNKDVSYDVK